MVHKNRRSPNSANSDKAAGHAYFVISEIGLANYKVNAEADTEWFPKSTPEILAGAHKAMYNGNQALSRDKGRNPLFDAAYENLYPHYEKLLEIYNDPNRSTGVEEIEAAAISENAVIYDITGVRIKSIENPGLCIVNGRKIMVK